MERGWVNRGGSRTLNFLGGLGLHFDIFLKYFPDVFQCFALVHSNLNYVPYRIMRVFSVYVGSLIPFSGGTRAEAGYFIRISFTVMHTCLFVCLFV